MPVPKPAACVFPSITSDEQDSSQAKARPFVDVIGVYTVTAGQCIMKERPSSEKGEAGCGASADGWSEPVPGRELHPLESSAFHGARPASKKPHKLEK